MAIAIPESIELLSPEDDPKNAKSASPDGIQPMIIINIPCNTFPIYVCPIPQNPNIPAIIAIKKAIPLFLNGIAGLVNLCKII